MIRHPLCVKSVHVHGRSHNLCGPTNGTHGMMDLPDELLLKIDNYARKEGEYKDDLWFHVTHYEHRLRNQRVINQLVLSGVLCSDLEYLSARDYLSKLPGLSVWSRTEQDGMRTFQAVGVGHASTHSLIRGDRLVYSIVDDFLVPFVVDEMRQARLAHMFDGDMLTLVSPPDSVRKGNYGVPTVRTYDARVTGRRIPGSHALLGTCKRMQQLLSFPRVMG